jgi:thiol-disulfide isomerase/thioredoxin
MANGKTKEPMEQEVEAEIGPMEALLGAETNLSVWKKMKAGGEHESIEVKKAFGPDVKLLGLYFSMHTCPPCREFTPLLAEIYQEVNEDKK